MPTFYVNKSGNDANSGATAALAKLTVQAAITASASNDTIYVGAGVYVETLTNTTKNLLFYADGVVTLSGLGLAGNNACMNSVAGALTIQFLPAAAGGWWVFRDYNPNATGIGIFSTTGLGVYRFTCCTFIGNAQCYHGIYARSAATCDRCVFAHFTAASTSSGCTTTFTATSFFYNCTFYSCSVGLGRTTSNVLATVASQCIFSDCTYALYSGLEPTSTVLFANCYYNCTALLRRFDAVAVNYTTIASLQALSPPQELSGFISDPQFLSVNLTPALSDDLFYLTAAPASAVGAYPFSLTRGAAFDPDGKWQVTGVADDSGWYNAGGNITLDGSNWFQLVAGASDSIVSPVYDMGASFGITAVHVGRYEIYPTHVIDQDAGDVQPNLAKVEYRTSMSTFTQAAGAPGWTVVRLDSVFAAAAGRFIQVRLTLRNNGVAA